MTDFTFSSPDFSATTITVVINTPTAKQAMAERLGCDFAVGFELRKSYLQDFAEWCNSHNLTFA
jgi:hypothetical protein